MGEASGFAKCRTFINSGNLLFTSDLGEAAVKQRIAARIAEHFGKPFPVFIRSAEEIRGAAAGNPFSDDKPSAVMAFFIDENPTRAMIEEARDVQGERLALGPRLIYVSYAKGIGQSKLKLPAVKGGTARNMNSVGKIADLLAEME